MPITRTRIRVPRTALQALAVTLLLASGGLAWAAGGKFTIVIGGKIRSVEAVDGGPAGKMVHARAVGELARVAGWGMSFDAGSGVVSVTRGENAVDDAFRGFKGSVTFVVDGKITRVASKIVAGVPYVAGKDVKKIAETMGFEADLDAGAGVLALTGGGGSRSVGSADADGRGVTGRGGAGLADDPIVRAITGGLRAGADGASVPPVGAPPHDGSVCGYLDSQKALWLSTEPSREEKERIKRLADYFEETKNQPGGNPADLDELERVLRGFDAKVQRRLSGTRDSNPPAAAAEWQRGAVRFVSKTSEVLALSFDLIRVMRLPPDRQKNELEAFKKGVDKIKRLDNEHKALGTEANDLIFAVRGRNRCGPP